MEEKGVTFTGITQATSDLDCRDGDLSISHNIINQDGAMRPIVVPDVAFSLDVGEHLLYVHKGDGYKNYFVTDGASLLYFPDSNKVERHDMLLIRDRTINKIVSIGNSVAVIMNDGIEYFLYKENTYKNLGSKPPELQISFGLVGEFSANPLILKVDCSQNQLKTEYLQHMSVGIIFALDDAGRSQVTDQVLGEINTTFKNFRERNVFYEPFFVCYAYKLLGQSDYMVSPPVLMEPVFYSRYPYGVVGRHEEDRNVLKSFELELFYNPCLLDYHIDEAKLRALKEWEDIITSVDIYVSKSIPIYDQNGSVGNVINTNHSQQIGRYICCNPGVFTRDKYNSEKEFDLKKPVYSKHGEMGGYFMLQTPMRSRDDFDNDLNNTSTFYLYKSYKIENLRKHEIITAEKGTLTNLAEQPKLEAIQDYNSHDILTANDGIVYNGRLSLTGVSKSFYGFSPSALVQYNNGEKISNNAENVDKTDYLEKTYDYKMTFLVKEDGAIVKTISGTSQLNFVEGRISYPNPNAYKVLIERSLATGEKDYAEIPMKPHKYLNCAVTVDSKPLYGKTYNAAEYNVGTQAYDYNKVYTSDVGSIFNFPLSGRTTIGTGEVMGIGAISRALSPGQFGQFPLYAFSTEGVYAMEVDPATGLFSSVHLISRDVCSNGKSITQIDGAVLFSSERGIMVVEGSEVRPISAEMDGPSFSMTTVARFEEILRKEGALAEIGGMIRFNDYIRDCMMAYDYPNNRIILFRNDMNYAYVYGLNSRSWSTMSAEFKSVVTDYPNVYIQKNDNHVLDLFEKINFDSGKKANIMLLSRPLKFGSAEFKSANTVINRGMLKNNGLSIILFASYDGLEYVPIGSAIGNRLSRLQGSPYRYFRVAVVGPMGVDEALSMTSIYITPKWVNKPR